MTPEQVRDAIHLLTWRYGELAEALGMHRNSLRAIRCGTFALNAEASESLLDILREHRAKVDALIASAEKSA